MKPPGKEPRWWTMRRAQSRQPRTYRCPFCGGLLHAMSDHMLLAPEGDVDRRRHAHTACVQRERQAGRLRTEREFQVRDSSVPSNGLLLGNAVLARVAAIFRRLWRR
jgi:2-keto-3-deoxy-galactonokinase